MPSARTSLHDLVTKSQFTHILDLELELEEVRDELRVDKAVQRESEPYYMVQSLKRQVAWDETEKGTVDFVLDLLQSSKDAGGTLKSTLADTQTRMEEEQLARTPTRDEG
ncbi:hypothetical protein FCV25MIE_04085 [Fagus crenata]